MSSTFGWLDTDTEHHRRMLEVVDLLKEQGTIDELGIGSIRDALSDALFPGTNYVHTRLRYVLFIPWLLRRAAHKPTQPDTEFRNLEYRMITSLLAGGEELGVIGNTAHKGSNACPAASTGERSTPGASPAPASPRTGSSTDSTTTAAGPTHRPRPTTRRPANRSRATASTRTCCRRPTVC